MLPPQIPRERRGEEGGRRALEEVDKNTAEGIRNQGERRGEKMAQEITGEEEKIKEVVEEETTALASSEGSVSSPRSSSKLNVHAPEFVPRSHLQPVAVAAPSLSTECFFPYLQFFGCNGGAGPQGPEWLRLADHEPPHFSPDLHEKGAASHSKNSNGDLVQKIVKQVEYQFSDANLLANDFLMKIMNRDPEGYVPMSVVASWKKIKALDVNNYTLIKALRTSSKLVLSEDGKKIKRKQLFTERDKEELQSRTVVVENLPEDYSRQNLEKIFGVAGSVKNIRICHPQEPSSARSPKNDILISNKLHALVEYETADQAEKAVEKLNDERNWRKGLRVRTMLKCSPKSVIRNKKLEFDHFDMYCEDDQSPSSQSLGSTHGEQVPDHNNYSGIHFPNYPFSPLQLLPNRGRPVAWRREKNEENQNGARKGWGRGRTKSLGQGSSQLGEASSKPMSPHGPRMPDGTRGFSMGRGKPLDKATERALDP